MGEKQEGVKYTNFLTLFNATLRANSVSAAITGVEISCSCERLQGAGWRSPHHGVLPLGPFLPFGIRLFCS